MYHIYGVTAIVINMQAAYMAANYAVVKQVCRSNQRSVQPEVLSVRLHGRFSVCTAGSCYCCRGETHIGRQVVTTGYTQPRAVMDAKQQCMQV